MMDAVKQSTSTPAGGAAPAAAAGTPAANTKFCSDVASLSRAAPNSVRNAESPRCSATATMSGLEWVVEAFGCSSQSLRDTAVLEDLFNNIIREMKLDQLAKRSGISFLVREDHRRLPSRESHLACHTFPEHGSLCLNLFCCAPRAAWDFETVLRQLFDAHSVRFADSRGPTNPK